MMLSTDCRLSLPFAAIFRLRQSSPLRCWHIFRWDNAPTIRVRRVFATMQKSVVLNFSPCGMTNSSAVGRISEIQESGRSLIPQENSGPTA